MAFAPVELTTDCASCGLEGGVVEVYDALVASCRFGLPAATRCKLCRAAAAGSVDPPISRELASVPANRCPACLEELTPAAVDERACKTCGARAELRETRAATRFAARVDLDAALDEWAAREGFETRNALAHATFADPDLDRLFEAIQRGEPLEIIADPFANMGVKTVGGSRAAKAELRHAPASTPSGATASTPSGATASTPSGAIASTPSGAIASTPLVTDTGTAVLPPLRPLEATRPPDAPALFVAPAPAATSATLDAVRAPASAPPRAIVYPLVSVIAADGEIHPQERELIDRFLRSEGLAPLADDEFSVHHPSEVAHLVPAERREDVIKLMCETASIDGMPDESERRVIRAYATAWHVDDDKLDFWLWGYESMNTSLARGLWMKIRRFVLSARWGEHESSPD